MPARALPVGYRHGLRAQIGYPVNDDMPGLDGSELAELYRRGAQWLDGGPAE